MRTGIMHSIGVRKRLCVSVLGGNQSIYFSRFRKYFGFGGYFVKQNCNFEYRIRCIELYMGTWFKIIHSSSVQVPSVCLRRSTIK